MPSEPVPFEPVPSESVQSESVGLTPVRAVLLAIVAFAGVLGARALAPSDLATRDQGRVVGYVVDAVARGHWLYQEDVTGAFASKPPLFFNCFTYAWKAVHVHDAAHAHHAAPKIR